jgi:hypothetical protein
MRAYLVLVFLALRGGCGINYVKPVSYGDVIGRDRAVIVYGLKVEGRWDYPRFSVMLDQYDATTGNITGNCLVHTHTEAVIDGAPGDVRYFAFDVPPGQYVYSPFHLTNLSGGSIALEATAGKHIYVGEFVYEKNRTLTLRRNLEEARAAVNLLYPELKGDLSAADIRVVRKPYVFLCGM